MSKLLLSLFELDAMLALLPLAYNYPKFQNDVDLKLDVIEASKFARSYYGFGAFMGERAAALYLNKSLALDYD